MRESGILMPVSSLPGPYGIGCFGKAAFQFVDFLSAAGQTIWQLLPLSPTGYGDSPYQSCSAFAGNPYFVDLEALEKEGLLTAADLKAESWGKDPLEVDYGTLYVSRFAVLRKAYAAWRSQCAGLHGCSYYYPDDYYAFTLANEDWLEDYALYMALKVANKMKNWVEWDAPYRRRDKAVLAAFAAANEEEIGFWKFVQYKFSAHLAQQFIAAVDGSLFFGLGARVLKDRSGDARRRAAMASDHDVFEHGHGREQADVLERAGHAERRDLVGLHAVEGRGAGGLAVALGQVKLDGPFGGQIDAGDAVEERGLPRAVGADKRDDLLPVDREIHLVERAQAAEIFGQVGYFEHRGVHAWPPVAGTSKADLELSILSLFVILYVRFSPEMRPWGR